MSDANAERVALVTGASSGIGRAAAIRLAAEGVEVALAGRSEAGLAATASSIGDAGGVAHVHRVDLARAGAGGELVEAAVEASGRLDVVVNAAGIISTGTVESTSDADWAAMMRLNVDAVFEVMRAAAPHLRATGGCIVNVSSVTGLRAFPGVLAYCVSKAAVDQLTRCTALELAADGVRVNAVNPGVVVTDLHRRGGMDDDGYETFLEHSRSTHPLGRVGSPEDIASAIAFLASSDSGWITGETLSVDGGRHQTCAR